MSETELITADVVEEWADESGYSQEDIDNLAAIVQAGQLAINTLSPSGLSDESQNRADAVYEALYEASTIEDDDDYPEFAETFLPQMAFQDRPDQMVVRENIDGGKMWDLVAELRDVVDDPSDVAVARFGDYRAYIVPAESESEAEELVGMDVDAADDVEQVDAPSSMDHAVAFKVKQEE